VAYKKGVVTPEAVAYAYTGGIIKKGVKLEAIEAPSVRKHTNSRGILYRPLGGRSST